MHPPCSLITIIIIMISSITTSIRWPLSKAEGQRESENGLSFVSSVPTLKTFDRHGNDRSQLCISRKCLSLYHKLHLYLLLAGYSICYSKLHLFAHTRYAKALLVPVKLPRVVKAPKHHGTQIKYLYLHTLHTYEQASEFELYISSSIKKKSLHINQYLHTVCT